jgi:hypothetical protein
MSEEEPKETEWEGFEQFHDSADHNPTELPEIKGKTQKEDSLYTISPQKTATMKRSSRRKKSEVHIDLPAGLSLSPAQDKSLKLSANSAKQEPPAPPR